MINYANRGMTLESDINITNSYYLEKDIAVIYKKPTPIKVTKISYSSRNSSKIKDGFFETPSTTDYNGIYKGRYIDFEAKEARSKTSFPLNNIHSHQIEHIKKIIAHNGISFLIVRFTLLDKTFLYTGESLIAFLNENDRKSIPIDEFKNNGYVIKNKYNPRIDYISVIEKIYGGMLDD